MMYDALVILTYGAPEHPDEIEPYLNHVTHGRPVSPERLEEVKNHYEQLGGSSPLNEHTRQLMAAVKKELHERGCSIPIYWGCRNWKPFLRDTLKKMCLDGIKHALAFTPSPFGGFSCSGVYEDVLREASSGVDIQVEKQPPFYENEQFIMAHADLLRQTLLDLPHLKRQKTSILFSAHSVPCEVPDSHEYSMQFKRSCELISRRLMLHGIFNGPRVGKDSEKITNRGPNLNFPTASAWQSASHGGGRKWLEPSVEYLLKKLAQAGVKDVILHPVGFPLDNMEIRYDLDVEAAHLCEALNMKYWRVPVVGSHPEFIRMVGDMVMKTNMP